MIYLSVTMMLYCLLKQVFQKYTHTKAIIHVNTVITSTSTELYFLKKRISKNG